MMLGSNIIIIKIVSLMVLLSLIFTVFTYTYAWREGEADNPIPLPVQDSRNIVTDLADETWTVSDRQYVNNTHQVWTKNIQVASGGAHF